MQDWKAIQAQGIQRLLTARASRAWVISEDSLSRRIHRMREGLFWALFPLGLAVFVAPVLFPDLVPSSWKGAVILGGVLMAGVAMFAVKLGSLPEKLVACRWTRELKALEAALLVVWMNRHPELREVCLRWGASRHPGMLHAQDFFRINAVMLDFREYDCCVIYAKDRGGAHALVRETPAPSPQATPTMMMEAILDQASGLMRQLRSEATASRLDAAAPTASGQRAPRRI